MPTPTISRRSTPFWVCGLPDLPTPAIRPFLMPMSPLTTPSSGSMITALVMTVSRVVVALSEAGSADMPSRAVLPPPYWVSSP